MSQLLHDTSFWVGAGFVIFMGLLIWKKVPAAMMASLDERAMRIKMELEQAAKLREESQVLFADYQRKQREAMKEAEEIIAHAKVEAERLAREAEADLKTHIARRQAAAEAKIAQAEQAAIKDVRAAAAELAVAAARKIIETELKGPKADALIDKAISEIGPKLH